METIDTDIPASAGNDIATTTTDPEQSSFDGPLKEEPIKSSASENPNPSEPEIANGAKDMRSASDSPGPGTGDSSPHAVTDLEHGMGGSTNDDEGDIGIGNEETQLKRVSTDGIMREAGIGVEEVAAVADAAAIPSTDGEDEEDVAIDDILDGSDPPEKAHVDVLAQGSANPKSAVDPRGPEKATTKGRKSSTGAAKDFATPTAKLPAKKRSPGSTDLSERLYARGLEVMRRRDELSRLEPEVGPFSPQLVTRSGLDAPSSANRQVFSRLYEESKMKLMRQKERREAAEAAAEAELYVSPSNQKKIPAKKATDMYERSMRMKAETDRKREEVKKLSGNHPFSPTLKKSGKTGAKDSTNIQRSAADRLYSSDHLQRRDERLEAAKSIVEMEGCTFSPRLVARRNKSSTDGSAAVYKRLYNKASTKNEVSYSEEKETFAPDITSSQRKVRASRSTISVHDRLHARAISPGKAPKDRNSIGASPSRPKSVKLSGSRIGKLYGKGVLKAQTELIAAQEEETRLEKSNCADDGTLTSAPAEVKTNDMDVSLLEMDSPKGKSDEELDPKINVYDTPKKHDTMESSTKDLPQAYDSGTNTSNGVKETIAGPGNEMSTPGSVIGLGPKSSESIGSIEFASI